jgi:hypothetical protein
MVKALKLLGLWETAGDDVRNRSRKRDSMVTEEHAVGSYTFAYRCDAGKDGHESIDGAAAPLASRVIGTLRLAANNCGGHTGSGKPPIFGNSRSMSSCILGR